MNRYTKPANGFTIVELLIVIVVIGILAAITLFAFNNVQSRAKTSQRDSDLTVLVKAILLARTNTGNTTVTITGTGMTSYPCIPAGGNTADIEPRDLPQTDACWTRWRQTLTNLSAASGLNLSGLNDGDGRGNPYYMNENEGENNGGNSCTDDALGYFTGNKSANTFTKAIPAAKGATC